MGSLSEWERTCGAVGSIGWPIVWWPSYGKRVLGDRVGAPVGLAELIRQRAGERGWSVEALEIMAGHGHLLGGTPPAASPAPVAHQLQGFTSPVLLSEFRHRDRSLPTRSSKSGSVARVGRVSEGTIRTYIDAHTARGEQ